ncbi:MAG TPA: helix-turn-helix domain-containing protein, partial [Polyangia bacterium]
PEVSGLLERYPWPGNVRELKAILGRAVLLHDDELLRIEHLPPPIVAAALAPRAEGISDGGRLPGDENVPLRGIPTLEEVELSHIRRVLAICGGNRTMAAQHLGITRQTLTKRLGGGGADD